MVSEPGVIAAAQLKLYTVSQVLSRRYHPARGLPAARIMLAYDLDGGG
ncbi:hypothetical protein M8494_17130 [Serratia ureilytica]